VEDQQVLLLLRDQSSFGAEKTADIRPRPSFWPNHRTSVGMAEYFLAILSRVLAA